jgi:menaquinol-cytochrome c reductase iron-sulfur subunit
MTQPNPDRRSFLRWAIYGLNAIFGVILGAPALAYLIDPRNRPAPEKNFRTVDGIRLDELVMNEPQQGVIRNVRWDAWTLHPNDVVGRVWVIKKVEGPVTRPEDLLVFTTVCPHLGCSINLTPPSGFTCPCHHARFDLDGKAKHDDEENPAPRDMDDLKWQPLASDPQRIQVEYKNFHQARPTKVVRE